jgi:hypothetical protein
VLAEAERRHWTVVDIKDDFVTVFGADREDAKAILHS